MYPSDNVEDGNGTQGSHYWRLVNLWWCSVNEAPQHLAVNACNENEREGEKKRDERRREEETRDATQRHYSNWCGELALTTSHRANPTVCLLAARWRIPRGLFNWDFVDRGWYGYAANRAWISSISIIAT